MFKEVIVAPWRATNTHFHTTFGCWDRWREETYIGQVKWVSEGRREGVIWSEGETGRAAHLTNRHHPRGLLCHSLRKIASPPEGERGVKSVLHIFRGGRRRWTSDLIAVEQWQRQLGDRKPFEVLKELICRFDMMWLFMDYSKFNLARTLSIFMSMSRSRKWISAKSL